VIFSNNIYISNYHFTHREKLIIPPYDRRVVLYTVKNLEPEWRACSFRQFKTSCRPRPDDLGIPNLQLNEVQWYLDLIRQCKFWMLRILVFFFFRFGLGQFQCIKVGPYQGVSEWREQCEYTKCQRPLLISRFHLSGNNPQQLCLFGT
jgi:hypothetical protein